MNTSELIWARYSLPNIIMQLLKSYKPDDPYCQVVKEWEKIVDTTLKQAIDKTEDF